MVNTPIHRAVPRLCEGILNKNRATLAESITLVESTNPARREIAHQLLSELGKKSPSRTKSTFRIGFVI